MSELLIVETRCPLKEGGALSGLQLAAEAASSGQPVRVWLMAEALTLLQLKSRDVLDPCIENDAIEVFADSFGMAQRNIRTVDGVTAAPMDVFTTHLLSPGAKPVWH